MAASPRPAPLRAERRGRILALVTDLAGSLARIDLDEIDGECYWRGCRADLLERASALRTPDSMLADPGIDVADLRAEMARREAFVRAEPDAAALLEAGVHDRVARGERVPLRTLEVRQHAAVAGCDGDAGAWRIVVYSGAWSGAEIERALAPLWADGAGDDGGAVAIRIGFDLVVDPARAARDAAEGRPLRVPHVEVVLPCPLPPPGVLAREYDAIVGGLRRWHLVLPGAGGRQEKEVALRTWAVGLLMAEGERFLDAMRQACVSASLTEVSQTRFGQDRQRLLERVPEAAPYLHARS